MREIKYWESFDGAQFDNEEDYFFIKSVIFSLIVLVFNFILITAILFLNLVNKS